MSKPLDVRIATMAIRCFKKIKNLRFRKEALPRFRFYKSRRAEAPAYYRPRTGEHRRWVKLLARILVFLGLILAFVSFFKRLRKK